MVISDLKANKLALDNKTIEPLGNEGDVYYNSSSEELFYHDNSDWREVSSSWELLHTKTSGWTNPNTENFAVDDTKYAMYKVIFSIVGTHATNGAAYYLQKNSESNNARLLFFDSSTDTTSSNNSASGILLGSSFTSEIGNVTTVIMESDNNMVQMTGGHLNVSNGNRFIVNMGGRFDTANTISTIDIITASNNLTQASVRIFGLRR